MSKYVADTFQIRQTHVTSTLLMRYQYTSCTVHIQLDGFAQDTPIGEIVDSCRVWESHSESDRVFTVNCESDVGNQSGDSGT